MKKSLLIILTGLCCVLFSNTILAQDKEKADKHPSYDTMQLKVPVMPTHKFYIASAADMSIFSTAFIKSNDGVNTAKYMGTLRFTYFFNFGFTFNYDFSKHVGVYAGIDIKNVGYIDHFDGVTVKRRTYNLGVPIGIKLGNVKDKNYFFAGGGLDVPINFKEKAFTSRGHKLEKYNEWFSDATPTVMPYVFIGYSMTPGITYKLQYYPNNFLNEDYVKNSERPFAGTTVNLLLFSIGVNIPYSKSPTYEQKTITPNHIM